MPQCPQQLNRNAATRGEAARHCVDYKRGKQMIKVLSSPSAPPLLRTRTLDAAGAILAMFWATLGEDLLRVEEYHRELLQSLAARFHALLQSVHMKPPSALGLKESEIAQLLLDYNACITFAVANIRAIEKLSKKLSKVVKFPLKEAILLHALQSLPFARATVPASIVEHLNILLLMAQESAPRRRAVPPLPPMNDALLRAAASTTTCGGCSAHMPADHKVLACGHTRCVSCFAMCRRLGMEKLVSQRHNLKDPRQGAPLKANDFSVILCDACAHTFIASSDECQPTHAAVVYLSSRCVSKLPHIARGSAQTASKAPRLQVNGGAFDDEAEDGPAAGSSDDSPRPSSPTERQGGRGSCLSEAAFYMSLGESDVGDCEATASAADCSAAAGAKLGADDSFDGIDGSEPKDFIYLS
jgi:hypothetical protein